MNLAKIHRLLQLIGLLQAGRGYNAEALAQACGVSRRTVFRDTPAGARDWPLTTTVRPPTTTTTAGKIRR